MKTERRLVVSGNGGGGAKRYGFVLEVTKVFYN